jgi:hypothetical protein
LWPAPDATTNAASRASRYAHRVSRNFIWNSFERGGGAALPLRTAVDGSGHTHWGELGRDGDHQLRDGFVLSVGGAHETSRLLVPNRGTPN